MSSQIPTLLTGAGLIFLAIAIACRFYILTQAAKAGVPRSFTLEKVDFPHRGLVVGLLAISLLGGLTCFALGLRYA